MRKQMILFLALLLVAGVFTGSVLAHSHGNHHGGGHMSGRLIEDNFRENTIDLQREILRNTERSRALRQEYRDQLLAEASEEELRELEEEILSLQEERERGALGEFRGMMGDFDTSTSADRRGSRGMRGSGGMMRTGGMMGSTGRIGARETRTGPGMMHTTIENEYEFLVHMIPHHEEAVSTARVMRENTDREEMREFADEIIITQTEEIEQMEAWLDERYPDKDHDFDYQPMMRDFGDMEGEELDRAFLEDMIFHHMEAVMTSQQLLSWELAEHKDTAELAANIINAQREEIFMMRNWLSSWYEDEQIIGRGHMGRGWQDRDFTADRELPEEDISQIREIQRSILRNEDEIESLKEEYRQLLRAEASEEELTAMEDEIIELQTELEEEMITLQDEYGFSHRGSGLMPGRSLQESPHSW
ncbi:DUF305 domain-containing protein [Halarsenatibacter silvermanii]|uniref:Uncharacterized conserved protein, DUF305 family n=1 Tax=Halarsenatibacter silvermanii TaxID=321763 RepID=A0A1G9TJJ1_9FIRM|nr:DUF305 domain-containing protein [Halarsenatibacter silvermanii]SDM47969.1 Uncharacterized conserved protein, DUF305 family [Halarsenatibacter silvermanii]